ncbi:hypothetical protein [Pseudonocardia sp. H11422]|uniref:hypothetical protein n=1 Tax=Pseudonocardia sp. H11422 TaxID=2835866 RepID=UPI001BDC2676|nr:hypothetical protein [Pseudonocardia sp. H11422]
MPPAPTHLCPVGASNGAIDPSWCFDRYADVLQGLPQIRAEADVLVPELHLATEGPWSVYYCPFDWVNPKAKVVIVGITPGLQQSFLANQEAQSALRAGARTDEALERACNVASFAGTMRTNLINMLDGIDLPCRLGIETTASLFNGDSELLHSTSSLLYPVFYNGKNYGGGQDIAGSPTVAAFAQHLLPAELSLVPDALVIPLGKRATKAVQQACDGGALDLTRVLLDFPHPSGGNGHRKRLYDEHRETLTSRVAQWANLH